MRVATWNLERGGKTKAARKAQLATLDSNVFKTDITVMTEPPPSCVDGVDVVKSLSGSYGSWVAIKGKDVERVNLVMPYDRCAVAARINVRGRNVVIYGVVLPWIAITGQAPKLMRRGEDSFGAFKRALTEQANDVVTLRKLGEPVLWVGDFNQSLSGPNWGGSNDRRRLLNDTLTELKMVAWNREAAHAKPGMRSIDFICGSQAYRVGASGRIDPALGNVTMSDHAGYWIDLDPVLK